MVEKISDNVCYHLVQILTERERDDVIVSFFFEVSILQISGKRSRN